MRTIVVIVRLPVVNMAVSLTSLTARQNVRLAKAVLIQRNVRDTLLPVVQMVSAIPVRLAE